MSHLKAAETKEEKIEKRTYARGLIKKVNRGNNMPLEAYPPNLADCAFQINGQLSPFLLNPDKGKGSKKEYSEKPGLLEGLYNDVIVAPDCLKATGQALIAVSPFNGYFSTKNMEALFRWAKENYADFNIFTIDQISSCNLRAMGYEESEAIKKTRKQDRYLLNKIIKSLTKIGIDEKEAKKKILMFSKISHDNKKYTMIYEKCCNLFKNNKAFQTDCLSATKSVLAKKMDKVSLDAVEIAVDYLLKELPIWLDASSIFNIPGFTLVYKDMPPYLCNLINDYSLLSPSQEIFIKNVENPDEKPCPF